MSLSTNEIRLLRDMVARGEGQKTGSLTSTSLARHYGLGRIEGTLYFFTAKDAQRARQMLLNEGVPLQAPAHDLRRSEAAQNNPAQEKSGTLGPHHDSVALKPASGQCILNDEPLHRLGYQVLTLEQARQVRADVLLVVENLESFRFLERNRWIDYQGKVVLAVFRGDQAFKGDVALNLIKDSSAPVWAYFDFDPAGLGMASLLPRLERLVLPDEESLTAVVRDSRQHHLYADQIGQWGHMLDADRHPLIQAPWELMRRLKAGLAQEIMDSIGAAAK